jgi:hypothetical protein
MGLKAAEIDIVSPRFRLPGISGLQGVVPTLAKPGRRFGFALRLANERLVHHLHKLSPCMSRGIMNFVRPTSALTWMPVAKPDATCKTARTNIAVAKDMVAKDEGMRNRIRPRPLGIANLVSSRVDSGGGNSQTN